MRKTKPEAKKSGSGYEHLPVRTQHIIDRLKFLETYRRVGRQTRAAQGAAGEFCGWSNVGRQARVGQLGQQMPTSGNMQ